jgi:tRNA(Ile)-lysidine synthase
LVNTITNKKIKSKIWKIYPKEGKALSKMVGFSGDSFVLGFLEKLQKFLANVLLVEPNSKILVAVSGGVDSVTLLDSLFILGTKCGFQLGIAHLNHLLRGDEASKDEDFVVNLSKEYGLPFWGQRIDVKEFAKVHSLSIEHAGREVRYDFLKRAAQSFGANYIATAHTLDDQAETILLNLIRGSGIRGLQGIAERKSLGRGLTLLRPFFYFKKSELLNYAEHRNLKWREDATNSMLVYSRNKVRQVLIPLLEREFNPNIAEVLSRTSDIAKSVQKLVNNTIRELLDNYVDCISADECKLDIMKIRHYDSFVVGEMIQNIISEYFGILPISYQKVDSICRLFTSESGKSIQIAKNLTVFKDRDSLYFVRNYNKENQVTKGSKIGKFLWNNKLIKFDEVPLSEFVPINDPKIEFFDFDKIPENIAIRSWSEGDRFVPLGIKTPVKLSDFLINEKVPLHSKTNIPIVVGDDEIIWVCGLRISEKFKVTKRTRRVLKGEIIELAGDTQW